MAYSNIFLTDFVPVFLEILKEKRIEPEKLELFVIDEEPEGYSAFEPADVADVLEQLGPELNFLTIYTDRPVYFAGFVQTMYEENGLVVMVFSKKDLWNSRILSHATEHGVVTTQKTQKRQQRLILDFEWEGNCYAAQMQTIDGYIPIHKKPWKMAENLDIAIPFGYNTVIVKSIQMTSRRPRRDRFEEAFYRNE